MPKLQTLPHPATAAGRYTGSAFPRLMLGPPGRQRRPPCAGALSKILGRSKTRLTVFLLVPV